MCDAVLPSYLLAELWLPDDMMSSLQLAGDEDELGDTLLVMGKCWVHRKSGRRMVEEDSTASA